MEAKKSQALQSATWRPRRTDGMVSVYVRGPRTRRVNGISSSPGPTVKAKEDPGPHSNIGRKREVSLILLFCSIQAFNELDETHPHWGRQFTHFTNSNVNLIQKHLHRHR